MAKRKFQVRPGFRLIMGKNCLIEVIKHSPNRIKKIYTYKDLPVSCDVPVIKMKKEQLTELVNSDSHQGYIALVKEVKTLSLKETLTGLVGQDSCLLALDSITDPQNLGTILRAAECFGVDGVIWSKNRGVDITPIVTKASVGASELIPNIKVSNLVESLKVCQSFGYDIVTAEVKAGAIPLKEFTFPKRFVLVMGSEGKGLRPLVSKTADYTIYIPMNGVIDSLNVSQATSVILSCK